MVNECRFSFSFLFWNFLFHHLFLFACSEFSCLANANSFDITTKLLFRYIFVVFSFNFNFSFAVRSRLMEQKKIYLNNSINTRTKFQRLIFPVFSFSFFFFRWFGSNTDKWCVWCALKKTEQMWLCRDVFELVLCMW